MAKVWNITDHPESKVTPRIVMVLGKAVAPGRHVTVDDARLRNAHKLSKDVAAGLVAVGPKPPADYLQAKRSVKVKVPTGASRAHGPKAEPVAEVVEKKVEALKAPAAPKVEEVEEPKEEEDPSKGKYKRKR